MTISTFSPPPPPPPPLPPPAHKINLAMITTILAVTFAVAFGLCTVGFSAGTRANFLIPAALATEALCLLGLLLVGIIGLIRLLRSNR